MTDPNASHNIEVKISFKDILKLTFQYLFFLLIVFYCLPVKMQLNIYSFWMIQTSENIQYSNIKTHSRMIVVTLSSICWQWHWTSFWICIIKTKSDEQIIIDWYKNNVFLNQYRVQNFSQKSTSYLLFINVNIYFLRFKRMELQVGFALMLTVSTCVLSFPFITKSKSELNNIRGRIGNLKNKLETMDQKLRSLGSDFSW